MEAINRIDCLLARSAIGINGGRPRPPLLDYELLVLGGRPKAALADERLIVALSFSRQLIAIYTFSTESRLHLICHKHQLVFYLAHLWRACNKMRSFVKGGRPEAALVGSLSICLG